MDASVPADVFGRNGVLFCNENRQPFFRNTGSGTGVPADEVIVGKSLLIKILLGCLLAFTGLLTIAASVAITCIDALRDYLVESVSVFAAIGCILLLVGFVKAARRRRALRNAGAVEPSDNADPLFFLKQLHFWGAVFLIATLPTFFLCRGYMKPKPAPVAVVPVEKPQPPPPEPEPEPEVVFPELKVQGVVCSGARSTAVINGRTVQLGELFEGVRVVAIDPEGITVELSGKTRQYLLN